MVIISSVVRMFNRNKTAVLINDFEKLQFGCPVIYLLFFMINI